MSIISVGPGYPFLSDQLSNRLFIGKKSLTLIKRNIECVSNIFNQVFYSCKEMKVFGAEQLNFFKVSKSPTTILFLLDEEEYIRNKEEFTYLSTIHYCTFWIYCSSKNTYILNECDFSTFFASSQDRSVNLDFLEEIDESFKEVVFSFNNTDIKHTFVYDSILDNISYCD